MNDNNFALVIDDNAEVRNNVLSILSDLRRNGDIGEILSANDSDDALQQVLKQEGKLQFIVSSSNIPGMPLAEFLNVIQFQPHLAGAPLLLLTEEGDQQAKVVAKDVGATAVLTMPLDPERLLVLTMAVTGTADRRRAKRIRLLMACDMELAFSKTKKPASAEVVNISDTGILLRTPVPPRGVGYVYDIAALVLRPPAGKPINVSARILRIEADPKDRESEHTVLMAFEYQQMNDNVRKSLRQYLELNDLESDAIAIT